MNNYEDEVFGEPLDLPEENIQKPSGGSSLHAGSSRTSKWWRYPLVGLASLALIVGGFFGMSLLLSDDPETAETPAVIQEDTEEDTPTQEEEDQYIEQNIPTEYQLQTTRTTTPRLEFTYPNTWELTEAEGGVTVRSPEFSFSDSSGAVIEDGYFTVYMRQGARSQDSTYIGAGLASKPSEPLTYSDPALGQREQTSVSFFGTGGRPITDFFLVAGNFSLEPGDTLGPDFASEPDDYLIAGGYSSPELTDDIQMHPVETSFFTGTEAYRQALDIIKALKIL